MKKLAFLTVILICSTRVVCLAQLSSLNQRKELFILGKTIVYLTNDYIKRTDTAKSPSSVYLPVTRSYLVTGPHLMLNILQTDSLDVWHGTVSFSGNMLEYNSVSAKTTFALGDLQVKISLNTGTISDWRDVLSCPAFKDSAIYQKGNKSSFKTYYQLANLDLNDNDSITLAVRRKTGANTIMILHIKKAVIMPRPFLAVIRHDSSNRVTPDLFIQKEMSDWMYKTANINSLYENSTGNGLSLNNAKYYQSSKLAFYFGRPDNYPDSSLVYKLTGGEYDDTSWHFSGHLILVPRLWANAHYQLLVRYKNSTSLSRYTFYVPPVWYQKYLYFIIYIPAFLFIFFATVIIARYRVKKADARRQKLSIELKSIRSQLNPHFVFNALSSIQSLINKNEIDLANQYLTEFSSLLRDTLQNHNSEMVPLAVDLKILENYIRLEQLRFNFTYEIKTEGYLELNAIEIPSLLLQPLVENAVKHGIATLKEAGRLVIMFNRQDNDLIITIADNGKGFDTSVIQPDRHGLRLTIERIALLNKTLKEQSAAMDIKSGDNGTVVTITFKNWLQA